MKKFISLLMLIASAHALHGQFLTLTESDESGKKRTLTEQRQTIDINSKISIDIDRNKITDAFSQQLAHNGSAAIDTLLKTLNLYKTYLEKLSQEIQNYQDLYNEGLASVDVARLDQALKARAAAGLDIAELFSNNERFNQRWEEELTRFSGGTTNDQYRIILRLLSEEIELLQGDLQTKLKEAGVYFQLAAWFTGNGNTTPVHLDGFDDLPPGEYYHFERNKLYLTQAQLDEFKGLQSFFEGMDRSQFFDKIIDAIPGMLNNVINEDSIQAQLNRLISSITNLTTTAQAEKTKVLEQAKQIADGFKLLTLDIKNDIAKYSSGTGTSNASSKMELLQNFMTDVNQVKSQIQTLQDEMKTLVSGIDFQTLGAGVNSIKTDFNSLQSLLKRQATDLVERATEGIQIAIYGRKINTAALEISNQVLKLQLDNIPANSVLDVNYVGKREPGDLLVLKAMLWKGDEKNPIAVETREFVVMNALPHLEMGILYAFAKPVTSNSNFKGGPLVSLLYKFKSHSMPYRNFLDFGIGIHAASFDFNNDDTPEFAGGIVASFLKDYVQFGWGFNFNSNRGYNFVGIRIPIPTSPISLAKLP
ncbi:MAG: hypothetical protein IPP15_13105 [Saprospiraceae bacterium]|uniref:Uncharacterized protein n=1 Tax=Candidatus Opimibacter skivensis TaxID=2982028 RepID=A0A9D7SUC1_9BACT|nr:hypothetical protein [Candidatus Opimibacter skivensis]